MSQQYDIQDIQTLEGIEAIRVRPGMYIGSVGPQGVRHITLEIISNAVDEYLNGHCTECNIKVFANNSIMISDNGRGIPFGKQEDGSETLENIFTKLHTGAKFDSNGETGYNTSGGQNGVGAKATNALSASFSVTSVRNAKKAQMNFAKGVRVSYEVVDVDKATPTGTVIMFHPDPEIFKEGIELEYSTLKKQLTEMSFLTQGLKFNLTYKENPKDEIISQNGLIDYLDYLNGDKECVTNKFFTESTDGRLGVKVALMYNETYSDTYRIYTNAIPNSGGTHLTGFRTALSQSINAYARANNILKEKDVNLTSDDLKEGLILALSLTMPDPVFSGQTKDVLTSSEARTLVQRLISQDIKVWLESNPKDAKAIIEKAILARTAREKAKKAKDSVRKVSATKSRVTLPGKLTDANSKNREECEIFLVEGK